MLKISQTTYWAQIKAQILTKKKKKNSPIYHLMHTILQNIMIHTIHTYIYRTIWYFLSIVNRLLQYGFFFFSLDIYV